jgi:hypothetical protein
MKGNFQDRKSSNNGFGREEFNKGREQSASNVNMEFCRRYYGILIRDSCSVLITTKTQELHQ